MQDGGKIDRIDVKILNVLQREGRITNAALADAAGPCLQRVKQLEAAGYISGDGAGIDLAKLGDTLTVFTEMSLKEHRSEDFKVFEAGFDAFPEVVERHLVSGGYDHLLKFLCRSVADYQDTVERMLEADIVIKSPIVGRRPAVERFAGEGQAGRSVVSGTER